jgi:hypothetical protein
MGIFSIVTEQYPLFVRRPARGSFQKRFLQILENKGNEKISMSV